MVTPDLLGKTDLITIFLCATTGTTAERPESCAAGNQIYTDIGTLEVYRGDSIGWWQ